MKIIMNTSINSGDWQVKAVLQKAQNYGLNVNVNSANSGVYINLSDGQQESNSVPSYAFREMPGVSRNNGVVRVTPAMVSVITNGQYYEPRVIKIGSSLIGGKNPCLPVIGTCAVDTWTNQLVKELVKLGVKHIRGGWRKPRLDANSFRGLGEAGLKILLQSAKEYQIESVWTEVLESSDIDIVRKIKNKIGFQGDIVLWVGARNIGNYRLLEELGKQQEFIVMLKNGIKMQNIKELLELAQFVTYGNMQWNEDGTLDKNKSLLAGNDNLIFCVRGLETTIAEPYRFVPNCDWISQIHKLSWCPVCFDPSHIAGKVEYFLEILKMGLKEQPDILLIESHIDSKKAFCDKGQAIPIIMVPEVLSIIQQCKKSI